MANITRFTFHLLRPSLQFCFFPWLEISWNAFFVLSAPVVVDFIQLRYVLLENKVNYRFFAMAAFPHFRAAIGVPR